VANAKRKSRSEGSPWRMQNAKSRSEAEVRRGEGKMQNAKAEAKRRFAVAKAKNHKPLKAPKTQKRQKNGRHELHKNCVTKLTNAPD
jgi:hypothetical protein